MTITEANNLRWLIVDENKKLRPIMHQIANGEYVVIVNHVYFWNEQDWHDKKRQLDKKLKEEVLV